jgi:hypothetical protein
MSQEQQLAARKKLANKQSDLEHVAGKLQQAEQADGPGAAAGDVAGGAGSAA